MENTTIHLEPAITEKELDQLRAALDGRDRIDVVIEAADAHQADMVMKILSDNGFDYQPRGTHDGTGYHIVARRKS